MPHQVIIRHWRDVGSIQFRYIGRLPIAHTSGWRVGPLSFGLVAPNSSESNPSYAFGSDSN